jgi:hypothetical protein
MEAVKGFLKDWIPAPDQVEGRLCAGMTGNVWMFPDQGPG